ncbi:class I SAM-dependent methyltransferase [Aurantimonas endophytica]|uniref:FkbM family methyltransferase n=1 Tax=Aurantimonas endophytica TaxID=1522175 RepID=A0A7W6H999_9HYPH|nr:class I SAM-dependent methyltransferase [Aurantimonas endophytica]MBB4000984.1 hypothetical protein [Aurantimonas endophytica]MCO6403357.1 class I SAM-dependent methyltransferase [Aurantimonas endophytica]
MQSPFWHYNSSFDAVALMHAYAVTAPPDPQHVTNFLGVKVSPRFFPGILDGKAGVVEPVPIPANWHADIAEWGSVLHAVDHAGSTFRMAELGCGWGCWLNNAGAAARSRGKSIELIGVEGDLGHVEFAEEARRANGFSQTEYRIIHGIAAASKGKALFPIAEVSGQSWGLEPVLGASQNQIDAALENKTHHVLDMIPLADIAGNQPLDLLHIDIQGGEADYVQENLCDMKRLVRRVVIGTHSRQIEGRIMSTFLDAGWKIEMERPAIIAVDSGKPDIRVDGVQCWWNSEL